MKVLRYRPATLPPPSSLLLLSLLLLGGAMDEDKGGGREREGSRRVKTRATRFGSKFKSSSV